MRYPDRRGFLVRAQFLPQSWPESTVRVNLKSENVVENPVLGFWQQISKSSNFMYLFCTNPSAGYEVKKC